MHIYLVICLVETIFNAVYDIIQGFEIQLTITFFLDDLGKKRLLKLAVILFIKFDQNSSIFSSPLSFHNVSITRWAISCLWATEIDGFCRVLLKLLACFNIILPSKQLNKNWKVDVTALTPSNLAFISVSVVA